MQVLIIGLMGVIAFILTMKKAPAPTTPSQNPTTPNQNPTAPSSQTVSMNPQPTPPASNNTGASLTGLASTIAGAAQAGVALGKAVDNALQGGHGTALTATTAEVGAGAILTSVAIVSLIGFAAAFPIGEVIIAVVIVVAVLAYAIASIISDEQRLAYGQSGARSDWQKHWTQIYNESWQHIRGNPKYNAYTDSQLSAMLTPFVDGFMMASNSVAYEQWMKSPRGITLDMYGQSQWGYDRGYFVGPITAAGDLNFDVTLLHTTRPTVTVPPLLGISSKPLPPKSREIPATFPSNPSSPVVQPTPTPAPVAIILKPKSPPPVVVKPILTPKGNVK